MDKEKIFYTDYATSKDTSIYPKSNNHATLSSKIEQECLSKINSTDNEFIKKIVSLENSVLRYLISLKLTHNDISLCFFYVFLLINFCVIK